MFLWWRTDDGRLSQDARTAIAAADVVFVSVASAWEAAIKASLGKLEFPEPFGRGVEQSGFTQLPISMLHAEMTGTLPPHHRDPFDRMLVAQALAERLELVTHDRQIAAYETEILWT